MGRAQRNPSMFSVRERWVSLRSTHPTHRGLGKALSASLRAQRSNPHLGSGIDGLLRCARNDRDMFSRSRDMSCPRFASRLPSPMRGRREDRVRAAPAVSRAIMRLARGAHEHTGSAGASRPSLRNGFTAYFVLFPENGSFASVARNALSHLEGLTPAPRRQNHTTSPYASATLVRHGLGVHRIPPRVSDDGQRPSSRGETA